ncbi:ABC transporter substrate-binding protein [Streptomyces sp. NPDC001508]|uniref:ABC transporter substrate-binding protein n=1 Tax=Streptomyces sp. NPDC001508 TaxID=3154656 RepID=UPI0033192418
MHSQTIHRSRRAVMLALPALAFSITACNSTKSRPADSTTSADAGPRRIAALSSDAADTLVQLVGPERLVVVPESTTSKTWGNHPDLMAKVPHTISSVAHIDPEQVLSYKPDLVVLTARHASEKETRDALGHGGVKVVVIENNWATFDEIAGNVRTLGRAVGARQRANDIVADFRARVAAVTDAVGKVTQRPSVLVMTSLGPQKPYILGSDSISSAIVQAAGANLAVDEAGIDNGMSADPELVVRTDPDAIVLLNTGQGMNDYRPLLDNKAVAGLKAVEDGRVLLVNATDASATAGVHVAKGLEQIARWLHPERFGKKS